MGRTVEDDRIRVCLLSSLGYGLFRPESGLPFGGAEVQCYLLAHELAKDSAFDVWVLTTVDGPSRIERHGAVTLVARKAGHRYRRSPKWGWQGLQPRRIRGYVAAYREMRAWLTWIDADVYVQAGAGVEVGAYALICRGLNRPFLYVVASSAELNAPHELVIGPLRRLFPLGMRLASAVVCRAAEHIQALPHRFTKRAVLIRSGHPVESRAFVEGPPTLGDGPHGAGVLWVGRLVSLKRATAFLDLARMLPAQRFTLVGMRDPASPEETARVLARARDIKNLTLVLDVPFDEIGVHFRNARLLVNTSTYEGFPNTFVQAALQGVPIVSWVVDPDGMLAEHKVGICARGSFDRLTNAVSDLAKNDDLCQAYAERARAYAHKHHDLVRTTEAFKRLFQEVIPAWRIPPDRESDFPSTKEKCAGA